MAPVLGVGALSAISMQKLLDDSASLLPTDAKPHADLPRVLLLSVVPPNTRYTGALMLHSMFKAIPAEKLSCYVVKTPRVEADLDDEYRSIPYAISNKPSEAKTRRLPGKLGALECFSKELFSEKISVPKITKQILEFISDQKPDLIWCTLEGQTMIRIADSIQKQVPLPMVSQVWDPPEWWMHDNKVDRLTQNTVLKTFSSVLKHSKIVATASWAMSQEYEEKIGCRTIPVIPGIPDSWASSPAKSIGENSKLKIGFAGQMYSIKEWNHLMKALDAVDWKIEGREVEIVMLGRVFHLNSFHRRNIRYLGWCGQKETLEILSGCDILYCPYWFDREFESPAKLSFPSKLTSYLASGRPILFHGPEYCSPYKFLKQNNAAVLCHGLDKSAIVNALSRLVYDVELYEQLASNGSAAFKKYLTQNEMCSQFTEAITLAYEGRSR